MAYFYFFIKAFLIKILSLCIPCSQDLLQMTYLISMLMNQSPWNFLFIHLFIPLYHLSKTPLFDLLQTHLETRTSIMLFSRVAQEQFLWSITSNPIWHFCLCQSLASLYLVLSSLWLFWILLDWGSSKRTLLHSVSSAFLHRLIIISYLSCDLRSKSILWPFYWPPPGSSFFLTNIYIRCLDIHSLVSVR